MTPPRLEVADFHGAYRFLSNFYPSLLSISGYTVPTVEHYYQLMRSLDTAEREWVRTARTPGEAKRRGRAVRHLRPDWEHLKVYVMSHALARKFAPGTELARLLDATGDASLVEGNTWHDQFWGDCRCGRPACQERGENRLGSLLEEVRLVNRHPLGGTS